MARKTILLLSKHLKDLGCVIVSDDEHTLKIDWEWKPLDKGDDSEYSTFDLHVSSDRNGKPIRLDILKNGVLLSYRLIKNKWIILRDIKGIAKWVYDELTIHANRFCSRMNQRKLFLELLESVHIQGTHNRPNVDYLYSATIKAQMHVCNFTLLNNQCDDTNDFTFEISKLIIPTQDIAVSILNMINTRLEKVSCYFEFDGYIGFDKNITMTLSFSGKDDDMIELEPILRKLVVMGILYNSLT